MRRTFTSTILSILIALLLAGCGGDATADVEETAPNIIQITRVGEAEAEPEIVVTRVVTEVETEEAVSEVELSVIELPEADPFEIEGDIITAGSSTVFPLAEAVAAQFEDEGYAGEITIDSIGSGAGFERFCVEGETDLSNASRPINEEEREQCIAIGRDPVEFRVGTDALAVAINTGNDWAEDVTMEELALIFSTAESWSDVRPEWPDEEILRYIPGTDSGTFDFFVEEVFDENQEPILNASNTELSEDDNVLVQGILGSPYAVGFFGYAFYDENRGELDVLSIEGLEPNTENVDAGLYPLARPLFIYSSPEIMQSKPQVAAYINYFLTNVNDVIRDVGYFPSSRDALNASRRAWLNALGLGRAAAGAPTGDGELEVVEGVVALPEVDPLEVEGDIITAGSSTVFPLAEAVAALFEDEGYADEITIDSIGSGGGFERFCVDGETDVSNASRPINEEEREQCIAIGRDTVEFRVGTDALAVALNTENDWAENVTMEELALIFSGAETWADVREGWPDEEILRYIPGTDSGTFDFFVEEVFDEDQEPILNASNTELSEDDNVLVQGILGSPYAVSFFGYAYYDENRDELNVMSVEGIEPNAANVDAGLYPLARPLFIYSSPDIMQSKPQVAAYINFFLTRANDVIRDVGYFPSSIEAMNNSRQAWLDVMNE
ncbi:MAG: PstS family phosphate ABC transporter substrate-binding protein [Candidatus Promineifilaceae bacterium]|nr:PstS family phosphate ABC transporter substrate-binding protein [Candidatus Promineifilaceae bacterium]